ncbi:MAG TPA: C39 family peptidase [Candidatus Limnocylindria bacterium]|nr:C39 family peptidase [Candidatus Limnocylindria bacterium]
MRGLRALTLGALLASACSGGAAPAGPTVPPIAHPLVTPAESASPPPGTSPSPTAPAETRAPTPSPPPVDSSLPAVSFVRADLATGTRQGVSLDGRALVLEGSGLPDGTYTDPYARATLTYQYGTWTSDWTVAPFAVDELIASWSAATPAGTWIEVEAQLRGTGRETKWYRLALWAAGDGDIRRTTFRGQDDRDASVAFDTIIRARSAPALDGHRLRLTLYRRTGSAATPRVTALAAMVSRTSRYTIPSPWSGTEVDLAVPTLSQETHTGHYPEFDGGGEAWCSPASTAMVLRFFGTGPGAADLAQFPGTGHADGNVDHAARYTFDWNYGGAGNWPFNTAHATGYGLDGFVTRLRSLVEAQRFIEAGIPLIASINGELPGFLFTKTNGHLLVIRGFTANGDVISNDPAALSNAAVRKIYPRAGFERVWLQGSGGVVYVIRPPGVPLPANVPGAHANW